MSSQKCASHLEIARLESLNFKISQLIYFVLIITYLFFYFFALKVIQKKCIFQLSTKILLYQNLFSANIHQIFLGITIVERLNIAFFKLNDKCIPLRPETNCQLYLEMFIAGLSGMVYGQTGLLFERACATFIKKYEKRKSLATGIITSIIVLLLSGSTARIIIWDDPLSEYQLACTSWPSKSRDRSTMFFSICTFISLFNLVISLLIRRHNEKLEYSYPFVVGPRFRKREVIDSTSTICFLTFFQFIFMFIYSFGVFLLGTIREIIGYEQYYFWVVWVYTIPFIAASFPILLIYRIRYSNTNRIMIIKQFTSTKQTQEDHIKQMKNVWN
nr:chemosensory receptor [Caenorhabditis elegans]